MQPAGITSKNSVPSTSINHRNGGKPLTATVFPPEPILIPPRREQLPVSASRYVSTGYFGTEPSNSNVIQWKGVPRSSMPRIAVATSSNSSAFGSPNTAAILVTSKNFPSQLLKARKTWRNGPVATTVVDLEARDRLAVGYDVPVPEALRYGNPDGRVHYSVTNEKEPDSSPDVEIPLPTLRNGLQIEVPPRQSSTHAASECSTSPASKVDFSASAVDGSLEALSSKLGRLNSKVSTDLLRVVSRNSGNSGDRGGNDERARSRFGLTGLRRSFLRSRSPSPVASKRDMDVESFIKSGKGKGKRVASDDSEDSDSTIRPGGATQTKEERLKVGQLLFGNRPSLLNKGDPNQRRVSAPIDPEAFPVQQRSEPPEPIGISRRFTAPIEVSEKGSDSQTAKPSGMQFRPINLSARRASVAPLLSPVSERPRKLRRRQSSMVPPKQVIYDDKQRKSSLTGEVPLLQAHRKFSADARMPGAYTHNMSSPLDSNQIKLQVPSGERPKPLRMTTATPYTHRDRVYNNLFKDNFWADADTSLEESSKEHSSYHDLIGTRDNFWKVPDSELPLPPWKKTGEPLEDWLQTLPDIPGLTLQAPTPHAIDEEDSEAAMPEISGALRTQMELLQHSVESFERESELKNERKSPVSTRRGSKQLRFSQSTFPMRDDIPPNKFSDNREFMGSTGVVDDSFNSISLDSLQNKSAKEMAEHLRNLDKAWSEQTLAVGTVLNKMLLVVDSMVVQDWEKRQKSRRAQEMGWSD